MEKDVKKKNISKLGLMCHVVLRGPASGLQIPQISNSLWTHRSTTSTLHRIHVRRNAHQT